MTTFLEIQNKIAFDLRGVNTAIETGFIEQIKDGIRQVINKLQSDLYWFNSQVSYIYTNPNQALADYYRLPKDYVSLVNDPALINIEDDDRVILSRVSNNILDTINLQSRKSKPRYYNLINDQLRVGPVPDKRYRVQINYVKKFPVLMNDTDTNPWLNEVEDLIRYSTCYRLAVMPLRNTQLASDLRPIIAELENNAKMKTLDYLSVEGIIPNDI